MGITQLKRLRTFADRPCSSGFGDCVRGDGTLSDITGEQFLSKLHVRSFPFPIPVSGLSPREWNNHSFQKAFDLALSISGGVPIRETCPLPDRNGIALCCDSSTSIPVRK
jgi:hypothetical protein